MLFHSVDFAVFLPVVFTAYWLLRRNRRLQNLLVVAASAVFYGWWDWRFLSLLWFSTILDYLVGRGLGRTDDALTRKLLLAASIVLNLGLLGFFKYFNFFADQFTAAFRFFGSPIGTRSLDIVLPVGISFYTFQTMSYSIDVYRRKMAPTEDWLAFFAFVGFFPQLVAGPIERASNLLPQFLAERTFDREESVDGLRQALWGFFKKVVIADQCAVYVDQIFHNAPRLSGSTLLLGAWLFLFQVYGDFSGYSDIAIGVARLFGIRLTRNFAYPFFSRDIGEYWRRFHISLSSWFRDYLYIPLGGSRCGPWRKAGNTVLIFLASGFWHGADWTFLAWGALNCICFLPLLFTGRNRRHMDTVAEGRLLPNGRETLQMGATFSFAMIAAVLFRSSDMNQAVSYLLLLFSPSLFRVSVEEIKRLSVGADIVYLVCFIAAMLCVEWLQREKEHALQWRGGRVPRALRWVACYGLIVVICWFRGDRQAFLYFQF